MEFYLRYEGRLKSKGSSTIGEKHAIRKHFHPQLKRLWEYSPLREATEFLNPSSRLCVIEKIGGVDFVPLVTSKLQLRCELDILMLQPQPITKVIYGGDIDNRLKTLFDALAMPNEAQLPSDTAASEPIYCLLQDDSLVTSVQVRSDKLLDGRNPNQVFLCIRVSVIAGEPILRHLDIGRPE